MKPVSLKDKAFDLRKSGYSYGYISKMTGLSKSTLSNWLTNVPYKPNKETIDTIGKARAASGLAKSIMRKKTFEEARAEARTDIRGVSKRDLFMLGLGLYIGEGSKSHNTVRIVNSDYKIIRISMRWFNEVIGVPKSNFAVCIHMYPDSNEKEVLKFWSKTLGLPLGQFRKSHVDYRIDKKVSRKGKLPFGTAHVTVKSCGNKKFGVYLFHKIGAWSDKVLDNKRV